MQVDLVGRLRTAAACLFEDGVRIASENDRFPRDNADSFVVLVEASVLPVESREPLRAMARFRTRLVHPYRDADDAKLHEALHEGLDDLARFGNTIARREW